MCTTPASVVLDIYRLLRSADVMRTFAYGSLLGNDNDVINGPHYYAIRVTSIKTLSKQTRMLILTLNVHSEIYINRLLMYLNASGPFKEVVNL